MNLRNISADELNIEDERFRISYFFSLDSLIRSIEEVGLLCPPLAVARDGQYVIVAGWKRTLACLELSFVSLPVIILEEPLDLRAFRVSISENLTVRSFSLLEKSEIIRKLTGFGEDEKRLIRSDLPVLSIPSTYDYFQFFIKLSRLDTGEKELIYKKNISLAVLQRLVEFNFEERSALFPLLLPLGQNKQKEMVEVIQELSLAKDLPVKAILGQKEIKAVLASGALSPLQKAEKTGWLLRKMRFPLLSAREEAFVSAKKKSGWPKDIKISPTPFYEDGKLHVEFSFLTKEDYLEKISTLQKAAAVDDFSDLFGTSEDD